MTEGMQSGIPGSFGGRAVGVAALATAVACIVALVVKSVVLPEYEYAGPYVLPVTGLATNARQRANDDAAAMLADETQTGQSRSAAASQSGAFWKAPNVGATPTPLPTLTVDQAAAAYEQNTWDLGSVQCALDSGWEPYQVTTTTADGVAVQLVYLRTRDLSKPKPQQGIC